MTGQMAVLGAGKTGVGWAARFALMGWHVRVFDPAPKAKTRLSGAILAARACLPALYDVALPPAGAITYHNSLAEAVSGVDWVQDGLPDRLALKRKMYQAVQASLAENAIIAARSKSADADELQDCATRPEQIVTVAAEGPIWLSPVCGVAGGAEDAGAGDDQGPVDLAKHWNARLGGARPGATSYRAVAGNGGCGFAHLKGAERRWDWGDAGGA
ncbi:3-hydroxyacyl-CoA dehydrogenase NAD-binding domain-containing protein [Fontisubflavum oceani]|uniref:3-hydroxyacyl-CoA dehydrogenase NAD-binding domain-containing protein n=1 Tax=Fontisubflavum oceani TaxID=2978973 RepID=UPI0025B48C90|nr:3-hydroxyacyl-CoA dehydrogenase NAD-binding domain-containing protein [Fontisubflavum oceani]WJY20206.1 3-hydroxyacyl-CoA dehydrogenase NAD-binding domain-containing protein [Fontisubflavum oceani]